MLGDHEGRPYVGRRESRFVTGLLAEPRGDCQPPNSCAACHIASRFSGGTPGWML